jgi:hypothetical protein
VNRSYYAASIADFAKHSDDHVLGALAKNHGLSLELLQTNAWRSQIELFRRLIAVGGLKGGHLFFEFAIPRMGKRVDVVLTYRGLIFVLEFKVGERSYPKHAIEQVVDYGLDLKNFHSGSHHRPVVPILVSTEASSADNTVHCTEDKLYEPLLANSTNLAQTIDDVAKKIEEPFLDAEEWASSVYKPTPTIIEAAQALYQGHSVEEISRSDSGTINLSRTAAAIGEIVDQSKENGKKSICFITGVPGSGKTLAGLNIANERHNVDEAEHAVFLSGNGPLVSVLREALARNELAQAKEQGVKTKKREALTKAQAFIQNIHHFRDDALESNQPPVEKVVVFDEAQRAWTKEHTTRFMKEKKGVVDFGMSEPEFLIGIMDRHDGYAVVICIVGGGQEINTGEAGLPEWFNALGSKFSNWDVYVSNELEAFEYSRGLELYQKVRADQLHVSPDLHLAVSIRSFRAELVSDFVKQLLDGDIESANESYRKISSNYPIVLTRRLETAKRWLRDKARGTERYGIVASSGALRLKPLGLHLKAKLDPAVWFLNGEKDVRSSYYLEDVATEFDIQGLELDWACVAWDGNFYWDDENWIYRKFSGTKWQLIRDEMARLYLKNAYRVLLTRARQGMVLYVPDGANEDPTRAVAYYDGTYKYLKQIGIPEI